jgi:heme exporter protein A
MVASDKALFAATNLACRRGERLVFAGVAFGVAPGQVLVLRGANGSGKSSLLRLMAGLSRPERGEISYRGQDVTSDPAAHRARLHFLGHFDGIKPALNAMETLRFWAGMRDKPDRAAAALEAFGLTRLAEMPCRFLSVGERKRVALARLVATPAPLWLLDEPTTALDTAATADLMRAIAAHQAGGGIAAIASHAPLDLDNAVTLALDDYAPRRPALAA